MVLEGFSSQGSCSPSAPPRRPLRPRPSRNPSAADSSRSRAMRPPRPPTPPPAPAPAPTPAPGAGAGSCCTPAKGDDTSWGLLVRGGYFGLPNSIADELFVQHPDIAGTSFGAEIRYHGEGGGRGVASIGLAVDYATAKADGIWQADESDTADDRRTARSTCSPSRDRLLEPVPLLVRPPLRRHRHRRRPRHGVLPGRGGTESTPTTGSPSCTSPSGWRSNSARASSSRSRGASSTASPSAAPSRCDSRQVAGRRPLRGVRGCLRHCGGPPSAHDSQAPRLAPGPFGAACSAGA